MSSLFNSIHKDGVWFDDQYENQWMVFEGFGKVELFRVLKELNTLTLEHIADIPMNDDAILAVGGIPKTFIEVAQDYLKRTIHGVSSRKKNQR